MQSADLEAKKQRRLLVLAWGKLARAGVSLRKYRHQWVFQAHENYMSADGRSVHSEMHFRTATGSP
ncbi:hypothetical protein GJ496_000746, partial [Pomphorhynchus laevis]